jgi:hypothetical protein
MRIALLLVLAVAACGGDDSAADVALSTSHADAPPAWNSAAKAVHFVYKCIYHDGGHSYPPGPYHQWVRQKGLLWPAYAIYDTTTKQLGSTQPGLICADGDTRICRQVKTRDGRPTPCDDTNVNRVAYSSGF